MIRRAGSARPEAISAERTRSRASETALSGSPTMAKAGRPGATCTCTSTARAFDPLKSYGGNTLDHAALSRANGSVKCYRRQEHSENREATGFGRLRRTDRRCALRQPRQATPDYLGEPLGWSRITYHGTVKVKKRLPARVVGVSAKHNQVLFGPARSFQLRHFNGEFREEEN